MKLNQTQIKFIAIAAVIGVILFLLPSSKTSSVKESPKVPVTNNSGLTLEESRKQLLELIKASEEKMMIMPTQKDFGRNPFVPASTEGARNESGLVLQGIFEGGIKPCVIINNKVVAIGEQIAGKTLKDIKRDYVVLLDLSGEQTMLSMKAAFPTHIDDSKAGSSNKTPEGTVKPVVKNPQKKNPLLLKHNLPKVE